MKVDAHVCNECVVRNIKIDQVKQLLACTASEGVILSDREYKIQTT